MLFLSIFFEEITWFKIYFYKK